MEDKYKIILSKIKKDMDFINPLDKKLVIVSKAQKVENIKKLIDMGHYIYGENYSEEAIKKITIINNDRVEWHYIGKIQSNKIRKISKYFDWVQTISSEKHAKILNDECNDISKTMNICVQVNIDNEDSKSGINISQIQDFYESIVKYKNLNIRGLMAIPSRVNALKANINSYNILESEFSKLKQKYKDIDPLSVGMSNDYQLALKYGANMIRIGSLIFGERK